MWPIERLPAPWSRAKVSQSCGPPPPPALAMGVSRALSCRAGGWLGWPAGRWPGRRMPGPQLLGGLGYQADRANGDLPPGQLPPESRDHRGRWPSHVAVRQGDVRSPRLGVQPAVAPGGSSRGLLDRAQNRLKGRSRPRIEHDRPGMINDTPQSDRHWPLARQQAAGMAGHRFDLLRRDLVKRGTGGAPNTGLPPHLVVTLAGAGRWPRGGRTFLAGVVQASGEEGWA